MMIRVVLLIILLTVTTITAVTRNEVKAIKTLNGALLKKVNELEGTIKKIETEQRLFFENADTIEASLHEKIDAELNVLLTKQTTTRDNLFNSLPTEFSKANSTINKNINSNYETKKKVFRAEYDELITDDSTFKTNIRASTLEIANQDKPLKTLMLTSLDEMEILVNQANEVGLNGLTNIAEDLYLLSRQVQLQQFNEFEKARSDTKSGVKQIRTFNGGNKNYFMNDHNGNSICGIHDIESSNNKLGISEFIAVLNGIEFRTGDQFYTLKQPAAFDETLHKTEPVSFPSIPDSINVIPDHLEQITEMREWFKAFQLQDESIRPYKEYFKPYMAYLEGAWLEGELKEEDAEQSTFSSYSGLFHSHKSTNYLPRKIMDFENNKPVFSHWDYRLLVHPLAVNIPTDFLKYTRDIASEARLEEDEETLKYTHSARFNIEGYTFARDYRNTRSWFYTLLDSLMEEIPGKLNYGSFMSSTGFDSSIKSVNPTKQDQDMNTAYYHRAYKLDGNDAMGVDTAQKSYSDRIYMATTNQNKVSGPSYEDKDGKLIATKVSYAVPFEMIYLTPLQTWNPFNIAFEENCNNVIGTGSEDDPYSAACPELYFFTPNSFYTGNEDPYDCTMPEDGGELFYFESPDTSSPVCLRASGVRILLPKIHGIDNPIRQRYPIMPVSGEGSSVWKKLNALEDSIEAFRDETENSQVRYDTGESTNQHIPLHQHQLVLTKSEINGLIDGKMDKLVKVTEADDKHQHILTLKVREIDGHKRIFISNCDSGVTDNTVCFDGHVNVIVEIQ